MKTKNQRRQHYEEKDQTDSTLPFSELAREFILMQKGRGNTPETITHYQQTIRKIETFLCWMTNEENLIPQINTMT